MIDWTKLGSPVDHRLFQEMCGELLTGLGLHVESTKSRRALLIRDERQPIRVECCAQTSREDDPVAERLKERLTQVTNEGPACIVVFTNLPLSEASKTLIERINASERCEVSISCVDGLDLERLLICQRRVYKKYFKEQVMVQDLDCSKIRSPRVVCTFDASTRFLQKDTEIQVRVSNSGPAPLEMKVNAGERLVTRLRVGTFGSQTVSIPANEVAPLEWSTLRVVSDDVSAPPVEVESGPKPPRLPIDHIYVDPLAWCETVRRSLDTQRVVYLSGGPGTGKSRLLREACDMRQRPVWIDLSQGSYGISLVDHVLARIFDLPMDTVRRLENDFLVPLLQKLGCEEFEAEAMVRYVKQDLSSLGTEAFAVVLARLASAALKDRTLVIDNVHRLRHLDAEMLRTLILGGYPGPIVITARDREVEDPEMIVLLESISTHDRFVRIVLDRLPVSRLISEFLEEATVDEESQRFLSVLRHTPNMQQFMLAIKSFAARELIQQTDDGRLCIGKGAVSIRAADYRHLLDDMLAALETGSQTGALKRLLEHAAAYGFSFEIEFLQETLGQEVDEHLELLESRELIVPEAGTGEADRYRFDHELTHEIIYGAIPGFRRSRLHRLVVEYMKTPERYREGADDGQLARHYEVLEDFAESAGRALKSARFVLRRIGLQEGQSEFTRALGYAEKLRQVSYSRATDDQSYVLEARALEGLIDSGTAISGSIALYDQIRKLDTLMKLYPADEDDRQRLEGRVAFYFARHYNLSGEHEKAREYIQAALDQLRASDALPNLGEALSRACTLEKNCGRWAEAADFGQEAIAVLEQAQDLSGLSKAYGNLGAVFLEAGRPEETIPWWEKAVSVVEGQGHEPELCLAQVNFAYIKALVSPEASDVKRELERGRELAQRLAMEFDETRARINLANWLFFHSEDRSELQRHLGRAQELIEKHKDSYLEQLLAFSRLNMDLVADAERPCLEAEIMKLACDSIEPGEGLESAGDNRALNMIEYLALRGVEPVRDLVATATGEAPEQYFPQISNPYRRGDWFITLY